MALVGVAVAVLRYAFAIHDHVGGVDFFFYVCNARDALANPDALPGHYYAYFPGVYAFWKALWWLGDGALPVLQAGALVLLAANALVLAAVVGRMTRSWPLAAFAGLWYAVACFRFGGQGAFTEPLATLPVLLGWLAWAGQPLSDRRGWALSLVLGLALGLALYAKQQAGLLSLGALALLVTRFGGRPSPHAWGPLVLLPFAAAGAAAVGIALEGEGLAPLERGLASVSGYQARGSFGANLLRNAGRDESAAFALAAASLGWAALRYRRLQQREPTEPWLELTGFAVIGALACLWQYKTRRYDHYALLALPGVILATTVLYARVVRPWLSQRRRVLREVLPWVLAAVPLCWALPDASGLKPWGVVLPAGWVPDRPWFREPDVAADLERLRASGVVAPGEAVSVFPPRHNSLHYFLDTHQPGPTGYAFRMPVLEDMRWDDYAAVIVLRDDHNASDRRLFDPAARADLRRRLEQHGFAPALVLDLMTVYRRPS
ncbi:MAG: hypothetical protein MJE66_07750 [Proteobacteria bacterium]|nr:hypothetical protein [Pseudomonadota bacterium]